MTPREVEEAFNCIGCGTDTLHEYYMVLNDVWLLGGGGNGMLCIGCLELRLGRKLIPHDFTDCRVNRDHLAHKSIRLLNRLGYKIF